MSIILDSKAKTRVFVSGNRKMSTFVQNDCTSPLCCHAACTSFDSKKLKRGDS